MICWEPTWSNDLWHRLQAVASTWQSMLDDDSLVESDYHHFLAQHGGLFFGNNNEAQFCGSKIRLGSDYEIDFVVPSENYSSGMRYRMIEIESPHDKLIRQDEYVTQEFNVAVQQLGNWKRWLALNAKVIDRQFPGCGWGPSSDLTVSYTVVIGRRDNSERFRTARQRAESTYGVQIWSFDRLTDMLNERIYRLSNFCIPSAGQYTILVSQKVANELACPYWIAMNDEQWKALARQISRKSDGIHHLSACADEIILHRQYSTLRQYHEKEWQALPTETQVRLYPNSSKW